ncbi:hypothetical protein TIFTF001_008737 [Ficus carica]|uniref:Uncharacterized protein n=1 Tax=Ficus carica TaxID=3494 RepID=A0AA87ZSQ9_FICCA|nr:hypothetical protein TIFTF001_008737 [Ficus carica]
MAADPLYSKPRWVDCSPTFPYASGYPSRLLFLGSGGGPRQQAPWELISKLETPERKMSLQIAAPTTRIYRGIGEDLRWFGVAVGRDRKAGDGGEKESAETAAGGGLLPIL